MVREGHAWVYRQYLEDKTMLNDESHAPGSGERRNFVDACQDAHWSGVTQGKYAIHQSEPRASLNEAWK
jgi:hypothetical protein